MEISVLKDKVEAFLNGSRVLNDSFFDYANIAYKKIVKDCHPLALIFLLENGEKPFLILNERYGLGIDVITKESIFFRLDDELLDALALLICYLLSMDGKYSNLYEGEVSAYKQKCYEAQNESNRKKYRSLWI